MREQSPERDNTSATNPGSGGRLLVLEGPDGVGKTTLAKVLTESLAERGLKTLLLSFPGQEAGTIGALV